MCFPFLLNKQFCCTILSSAQIGQILFSIVVYLPLVKKKSAHLDELPAKSCTFTCHESLFYAVNEVFVPIQIVFPFFVHSIMSSLCYASKNFIFPSEYRTFKIFS